MVDVEKLRLTLLHTQFETGQEILYACKNQGVSVGLGYAIAYRAGLIEGRKYQKENLHKVYSELAQAKERLAFLEANKSNMVTIADLINNPVPDVELDDVQPTPGAPKEEPSNE